MTRIAKLALIAVAVAGIAVPAFAQPSHHRHTVTAQSGLNAFAMTSGGGFSAATQGGGSIGYNENLRTNQW